MSAYSINISRLKKAGRQVLNKFKKQPEYFLKNVKGVIHIGAHRGQERDLYAAHDLNVLWIEANPEVFIGLKQHILGYPKQRALCCLVTDMDDREYAYHVSSNDGESSSILDLKEHKALWPEVSFAKRITLKSVTLSSLMKKEGINPSDYDALVLDTQGSELMVLNGGVDTLTKWRFIKTEVADFEAYQNCCQLPQMDNFLRTHAFRRAVTSRMAGKPGIGSYFEVTYSRNAPSPHPAAWV